MALDERLRRGLEGAARPADPTGVYEDLIRRRERRRVVRRAQAGLVAFAIFGATVGGLVTLARRAPDGGQTPTTPPTRVRNGALVFSLLLESGDVDLFAVRPDGTDLRRLTAVGSLEPWEPDVSPDGATIAAVRLNRTDDGVTDVLVTVPIVGGGVTDLSHEDDFVYIFDPEWSPDGASIAFAGARNRPAPYRYEMFIYDLASDSFRVVPTPDGLIPSSPTWSPDGTRLAFALTQSRGRRGSSDLYSAATDGSALVRVTDTPAVNEFAPSWSWANGRIAFGHRGDADGISTIASDGSDRRAIHEAPSVLGVEWSPDGTAIAFAQDTGQVYTIAADGSDEPRPVPGVMGPVSWQALAGAGPSAVASPSAQPVGEDIGVGFPVCNVTSVRGEFVTGVDGTAYVATRFSDQGRCRELGRSPFQVLAVDVTGDALADVSYGPLECDAWCTAFVAPDVDGDGDDEVLIQNIQFSIRGLMLFEVIGGREIVPVTVAGDGTVPFGYEGFEGGEEPQFWLGGDAGNADVIRCERHADGRALISVTSNHPIEGDTIVVTETTFTLKGSALRVVDVERSTWPVNDEARPFLKTGGCGASLPYP